MDWIAILSIAGSALAALFAVRVAFSRTENRVGAWTLAGFLFSAAMLVLDATFYRQHWFALLPEFYGVANPFVVASGPLFYLYACATTDPARRWRWTLWLHLLPAALFLVLDLPLLFLPAAEKIELARRDLELPAGLVERLASVGVVDLYLLSYFVLAWWRLWRRRERIEENREEGRSHPLRGIGLLATVLVLLNVVSAVLDFTPWMQTGMTIVALAGALGTFAVFWAVSDPMPLFEARRPGLPAGRAPAVPDATLPTAVARTADAIASAGAKPKGEAENRASAAEVEPDEETRRLADKLKRLMEAERPYLDAGLSLQALSESLGTTRHRASLAIRCAYGATFYQVVAVHRVREAARVLRTADGSRRTIADIAFAAGFNTLSAFNTAFRVEFGMTPKAYREQTLPSGPAGHGAE